MNGVELLLKMTRELRKHADEMEGRATQSAHIFCLTRAIAGYSEAEQALSILLRDMQSKQLDEKAG